MSNMGYCRFENTLDDLEDCQEHIFDLNLSHDEEVARDKLIKICREIVRELGEEYS